MGIFQKWLGKNTIKTNSYNTEIQKDTSPSVTNLSLTQRTEILTLYDQGARPTEIAEELGLNAEKVSRVITIHQRGMKEKEPISPDGRDELQKIKLEIEKIRLEREKMKLQYELDDIKRERERQLKAEDGEDDGYSGEPDEYYEEETQDPIYMLLAEIAHGFISRMKSPINYKEQTTKQEPGESTFTRPAPATAVLTPGKKHLSDTEIEETLKLNLDNVAKLKKLKEPQQRKVLSEMLQLDDDTQTRVLEKIKAGVEA